MAKNETAKEISVKWAAQGPLKNVDLEIPLRCLTCFTGRCGSGSRTMAVEVLYAESSRRYMLALAPFERENLGGIGRVDVDHISGLPPAMFFDSEGIQRKEGLAAFLQLEAMLGHLWHRHGVYHCLDCGESCRSYTEEEAAEEALSFFGAEQTLILAPLVWAKEVSVEAMVEELRRAGFMRILQAGNIVRLDEPDGAPEMFLECKSLEVVIDRLVPGQSSKNRIVEAIRNARAMAAGNCLLTGAETDRQLLLNKQLTCVGCGRSYPTLTPDDFLQTSAGRHPLAGLVRLAGQRIKDLQEMTLNEVSEFLGRLYRETGQGDGGGPLEAVRSFGLGYLKLGLHTDELSAGEQQRLLLAGCLGSGLTGILYIFEAPMVGLQPREARPFIDGLRALVNQGNTVVVLDHSVHLLDAADEVIAFSQGKVKKREGSGPDLDRVQRRQNRQKSADTNLGVRVEGEFNLAKVEVEIPLHRLVCLTGASGAGKSALLRQVVLPALQSAGKGHRRKDRRIDVRGGEQVRRVVDLGAREGRKGKPLLVELGGAESLADLFAGTPAALKRGYPKEWFQLDAPGGRCVNCEGRGVLHYDLEFLEDISLNCPVCEGRRYRPEILEITLRGLNISDVLEMTIEQASQHFLRESKLKEKLDAANFCGLGRCQLGISSDQLEKTEYLWLRLAVEMVRVSSRDLLILDNPSAGSHPEDLQVLLHILDEMVSRGASVLMSDQHPVVLAAADWLIEMGPGGGPQGGQVVANGHPGDFAERVDLFLGGG